MTASTPKIVLPAVPEAESDTQVSRFDLERYVCGELSPPRRAVVASALAADPALQALHDDLVAADKAFLIALPPAPFLARLHKPASLWSRLLVSWQAGLGAAAAAAAVVVVALSSPGSNDHVDGGTRTKGFNDEPRVSFFVKEDSAARLGHAGEELKAGDQIQLAVKDVDKKALVLVGVDGSGTMTIYASESVQGALSKGNGPPRVLPASLVLDDTTGPERFFLVYGDDVDVLVREVKAAAQRLADEVKSGRADLLSIERLAVDADYPQSSIHIIKVR